LFTVSSFLALVKAVRFNVVALPSEYGGTDVGVVIDNEVPIIMTSSVNGMYWSLEANRPLIQYYYVILNEASTVYSELENFNFSRTWLGNGTITYNQVFGRKYERAGNLLKTIPRISLAHKGYTKFSKLFQEGEIPILHFHLSDQNFATLTQDTGYNRETKYTGQLDLFTPEEVFQFTNVELSLAGMGTRGHKKRPFKISLSKGENDSKTNTEVYDRSSFKLRNLVYDPSYIKNKMTVDIMTSLGIPVAQSNFARFYINNTPFGLYDFSDVIKTKFVKNYFHTNQKKNNIKFGTLYKGCSYHTSDLHIPAFLYRDYPSYLNDLYQTRSVVREGAKESDDIVEFIMWLDSLTESTPEKEIKRKFNVDVFLKSMAVEYLTCQWDGYLQGGNNYYIYRNSNGYFTFFPFDFDITFGKWCNFKNATFEEFCIPENEYGDKGIIYSQLYSKILSREPFKTKMKTIIDNTVSRLFNIKALGDRLEYLKEFLADDIMWDLSTRTKLPTQTYNDTEEEPIPSFDNVMAEFSNQSLSIDDFGVYNWIKHTSEKVAAMDDIKFDTNFKLGEVGGSIVVKENGTVKVDGYIVDGSISRYTFNTFIFAVIFIIYILF